MGTTETPDMFAAAVWWDPQARKVIVNKRSVVTGVLVAQAGNLSFVSPTDTVFDLRRGAADVEFLRATAGFDVRAGDTTYRIHLRPPTSGVPTLDRDGLLAVGLGLARTVTVTSWVAARLNKPADSLEPDELEPFVAEIVQAVAADAAGVLGRDRWAALRSAWSVADR